MDAADLVFSGISRQAEMVRAGEVSSRELVQACLSRIERLDPQINAWRVVRAEQALAEAEEADLRAGEGDERPLLGVPIAVKDDIDVAGEATAYGSSATDPTPCAADAPCVAALRAAGAIVLGKTNVPELTIWPFTESRTFGATTNPWDTSRSPGGSSGGTAAAVAAGMVGAGLGTDGGGSIRIPAAWCGLLGIKPTAGLVSAGSHDDRWRGLSVVGPIARRVADAALLLDAIVARAPRVPFAQAARAPERRLRIAVSARKPAGTPPLPRLHRDWRAALEETAELLRSLGHDVVEIRPRYRGTFHQFMARYLRGIADEAAAVAHRERLEPRTRGMARLGSRYPSRVVEALRRRAPALRERIWASLDGADVLMTPTNALPAPEIGRWADRGALATLNGVAGFVPYTPVANLTGEPGVSVPAGVSGDGLPVAVQLTAPPDQEHTLIALAAEIEAARPWADRRPPVS